MNDNERDTRWERIGETYHVPPETPREDMWKAIEARIAGHPAARSDIVDISRAREAREGGSSVHRFAGWAVAAAAVLILGVGIGRMTAPGAVTPGTPMAPRVADVEAEGAAPAARSSAGTRATAALTLAEREHFGRTESLLTMVRADARSGRVDPAIAGWAEGLLTETRLLLDAQEGRGPAATQLLLDLELVLAQIVGAASGGTEQDGRARQELELTLRSLDQAEVLPRVQAASMPPAYAGM